MNESPRLLKTWQEKQEMQSCDEKMNTEQIEKSFTSSPKNKNNNNHSHSTKNIPTCQYQDLRTQRVQKHFLLALLQ